MDNEPGSRVQSILVRCNECLIPTYEELDLDKTYRLILPSFLTGGGDGLVMISNNLKNVQIGRLDIDVFSDYLSRKSPVFEEIGGRIIVKGSDKPQTRNLYS